MPRVPQTDNVVPMQPQAEMPSPTLFAMAASMMHAEGRFDSQPVSDRLYLDENGRQKSLNNERTIDQFSPQINDMVGKLNDEQIGALERYDGSGKGKFTPKDQELIDPILKQVDETTKALPQSTEDKGEIRMHNWGALFRDEVISRYHKKGSGV